MNELNVKLKRIRELLKEKELKGVLLTRQSNFAWVTCGGDSHVVMGSDAGVASVLITPAGAYIVADNIEAGRIYDEELGRSPLLKKAFRVISLPWHKEEEKIKIIKNICPLGRLGTDIPLAGARLIGRDIVPLRYSLTPEEINRYEWLGRDCAKSMGDVCRSIKTGDTEHEIAGRLAETMLAKGIVPTVLLIASDERIFKYRHPIPADKKIKKHAMVVLCGRKWGLIVSLTRLVYFGRLPAGLRRKHDAVAEIDACFIANTRPGINAGTIFTKAMQAYKSAGFADEWGLHHQGGATGYGERDYKATPGCRETVLENQAFAWNPSITGTKSEDTIIALPGKAKIISAVPGWPSINAEYGGEKMKRPDILVK